MVQQDVVGQMDRDLYAGRCPFCWDVAEHSEEKVPVTAATPVHRRFQAWMHPSCAREWILRMYRQPDYREYHRIPFWRLSINRLRVQRYSRLDGQKSAWVLFNVIDQTDPIYADRPGPDLGWEKEVA